MPMSNRLSSSNTTLWASGSDEKMLKITEILGGGHEESPIMLNCRRSAEPLSPSASRVSNNTLDVLMMPPAPTASHLQQSVRFSRLFRPSDMEGRS